MKFLFLLCAVLALARACKKSSTTASGSKAPRQICSGALIFEDHFNRFDRSVWKHEKTLSGCGNGEFQWYDDDNKVSYAKNGKLFIRPILTSDVLGGVDKLSHATLKVHGCTDSSNWGCERKGSPEHILNPVKSARIVTRDNFSFKYGRVEVRAKLPAGDWLWPAIWFMPQKSVYGGWPRSGEIDLMESRGNKDLSIGGRQIGTQQISQTLHFGAAWNQDGWAGAHGEINNGGGYDTGFHLYQMTWTPTELVLKVDNRVVKTLKGPFWHPPGNNNRMAPFDQEFYFIINLAVGGTNSFFPDQAHNGRGGKPWRNNSPKAITDFWNGRRQWFPTWGIREHGPAADSAALQVDYIKVWAL